jgi:hypothetical protein
LSGGGRRLYTLVLWKWDLWEFANSLSSARQGGAAVELIFGVIAVAKKKSDASSKPKSAPRGSVTKPSKVANRQAAGGQMTEDNKATASTQASRKVGFSREDIGATAGDVWRILSERGGQTLAGLKKSIDAPDELIVAAVGWLSREDKLAFASNGKSVTVSLL